MGWPVPEDELTEETLKTLARFGDRWQARLANEVLNTRAELETLQTQIDNTVKEKLQPHRDAMVATVSFLSSVIRGGESFTPEVKQAIDNYYTRWQMILGDN